VGANIFIFQKSVLKESKHLPCAYFHALIYKKTLISFDTLCTWFWYTVVKLFYYYNGPLFWSFLLVSSIYIVQRHVQLHSMKSNCTTHLKANLVIPSMPYISVFIHNLRFEIFWTYIINKIFVYENFGYLWVFVIFCILYLLFCYSFSIYYWETDRSFHKK